MTFGEAPAPRTKSLSGWNKILIGCGVGCGLLLLVAIIAGGIASVWFFKPGEQIATERIIGEESIGVARAGELAEDPGTQELLGHVMRRLDEIDRATQEAMTPDSMQWINHFRNEPNAQDLNIMIPWDVTFTLERVQDKDEVAIIAALNFRTFVRPIAAMFSFAAKQEADSLHRVYNGFDVYELEKDEGLVSWVDSTLLFATSAEALERALDRVASNATVGGVSEPPSSQVDLEGAWDLTGRLRNDGGLLVDWFNGMGDQTTELPSASENLELQFGIDIATGSLVRSQILLEARDTAEAEAWQAVLVERLNRLDERALEEGMTPSITTRIEGTRVYADIEMSDVENAVANFLRPGIIEISDEENP